MIDDKDLEIINAHLASVGAKEMKCPVCGSQKWIADGPHAAMRMGMDALMSTGKVVPVMKLICARCMLVREFAWLGIKGEGR